MNPLLCSEGDCQALIQGLLDDMIDTIANDHVPHSKEEKGRGMEKAPFGIVALETVFPLPYIRSVRGKGTLTLEQLVCWMSEASTKRFQIERGGKLKERNASDFVLMDLDSVRKVEKQRFYSMGRNIPFDGIVCSSFAVKTFMDGACVYDNREGLLK